MCRLMDAVLHGLAWEVCMPFLDDVGIWSTGSYDVGDLDARKEDSFKQMLLRTDQVLTRLREANLTCKASKCVFFATETEYLGHVVGREGLKMGQFRAKLHCLRCPRRSANSRWRICRR